MPLQAININNYKVTMGNEESHQAWKNAMPSIFEQTLGTEDITVDFFNLRGEFHTFKSGAKDQRLVIFANASFEENKEHGQATFGETIFGVNIGETYDVLAVNPSGFIITSDEGIALAEFHEDSYTFNIAFDLFKEYTQARVDVFRKLMEKFNEMYFKKKHLRDSWVHSDRKAELAGTINERMRNALIRDIEREKNNILALQDQLNSYKNSIVQTVRQIETKQRFVAQEETFKDNDTERLFKEFDLIVNHEKIEDLHIKEGKLHLFTKDIYIDTDAGDRYYIGKFRVEVKLENSDVKFFNLNNPRQGFWSGGLNQHPHVDSHGSACLGNVGGTIAELCAQYQIYPLALVLIDFLESVNLADSAGKYIVKWDKVDASGRVIDSGNSSIMKECRQCEEDYAEENEYEDGFCSEECYDRYHD